MDRHVREQTSVVPDPAVEYPAPQVHVVDPDALVLPVGQAVQEVAPGTVLYVFAEQARRSYEKHDGRNRPVAPSQTGRASWVAEIARVGPRTGAREREARAGGVVASVAGARGRVGTARAGGRARSTTAGLGGAEGAGQACCKRTEPIQYARPIMIRCAW